jgi:hypothetical protein
MREGTGIARHGDRHLGPSSLSVPAPVGSGGTPALSGSRPGRGGGDGSGEPRKPRLLDDVRGALRIRRYSLRTEDAYVSWIKRFILFHGTRHPLEMGQQEMTQCLSA